VFQTELLAIEGFDNYPEERMSNKARISNIDIYNQRELIVEFFRRFMRR